ncbi:MAG: 6-carboxytetrahydropterin synthase [Pseudomonadota bacterium]
MYTVSKTFSFCYGHRLVGDKGKCRHLHGHSARATFILGGEGLDRRGMVCHFDRLKETVGAWIAENLDHTMLLARDDSVAKLLADAEEKLCLMNGNPTAENIARLLFERAEGFNLPVLRVEVWESDTSKATFEKN